MFFCKECGNEFKKWYGKCPNCKEFNTLVESKNYTMQNKSKTSKNQENTVYEKFENESKVELLQNIKYNEKMRLKTNILEFDRVIGGGIVPGSLTLLGGNPGIGKSTLLLQICEKVAKNNKLLYISGEESVSQIKLRADRLKLNYSENFLIANTKNLENVFKLVLENEVKYLIIDSIQTMYLNTISGSSGSVSQVKECTLQLMYFAKQHNITIFIIGHVTKDGDIAGPKLLEHMVDTVIYLEGERNTGYKILRSIKNRYGKAQEIGVFQMESTGLHSINEVEKFFMESEISASGNTTGIIEEGERFLFVQVQSLLIQSDFGYPKRTTQNYDLQRLNLLLGVIQKRVNLNFNNLDCYLNISGNFNNKQPSLDLAVVMSLISARNDIELDSSSIFLGEVALSGEIKTTYLQNQKIEQADKLGFKKIYCRYEQKIKENKFKNIEVINCVTIAEVLQKI